MLAYRTKWHGDWTKEWFYTKVDSEQREDFKHTVMSPLEVSFNLKKPKCEMGEAAKNIYKAFNVVAVKIGSRDLIQEFLTYNIFPTRTGWKLPKVVKSKEDELVTLAFEFKEKASFRAPSGWLKLIETKCNEIAGNYIIKEDEAMTSAFGTEGKWRLNRVMNALGFEYPDYSKLVPSIEAGDKPKRSVKLSGKRASKKGKQSEPGDEEMKDVETVSDEETPSNMSTPFKKKAKKMTVQEQWGGSASTCSLGCT
jgi:hypothetical protein